MQLVGNNWDKILEEEYYKEYFINIVKLIKKDLSFPQKTIY